MARVSVQWTVSLSPELSRKALGVAKKEIRSRSELVREALREYVSRRERFEAARRALSKSLDKKGVRTLEDVERLIDEGRA